ncbi:hypothetical protein PR003_g9153 [Phytophthora rubi]|uniref:Uncharacterized protein n=1 Tax=Phytophthora rubi TaxID=129364 RepID=A0A6A3NW11_9STRA|nr:hypothetical protein PR001_g5289 [Phytophthora rubi]KAE9343086.1 hypothetical protein PR003_g9153 [Phytophthora rubi]
MSIVLRCSSVFFVTSSHVKTGDHWSNVDWGSWPLPAKPEAPAPKKHSGDPCGDGGGVDFPEARERPERRERSDEDARFREAYQRRGGGETTTRFQESRCYCCDQEYDIRFFEAHAKDEEGDRFFEACTEEGRGEEAGYQAASEEEERRRTARLPPTRTDVLLPGSHEAVSSESSDTDTPNHGVVTDDGAFTSHDGPAPRASASPQPHTAMANFVTAQPQERSPSPDLSLQVDYEE